MHTPYETEDFIVDYEEREMDQIAIHIFYDLLQELSERNQQIIILRFGLYGNVPHTYIAISKIIGISYQSVHRVIKKLFHKVRLKLQECHGIEIPNQKKK